MFADLDRLQTAVWVYDIDNFCIVWANHAGLKFWCSPNIESLQKRDLKTGASSAVKQALRDYQAAFKLGEVFQENWQFTPNDTEITAFCQCSGIELDNGRIGMLVEAVSMDNIYSRAYFNESVIISTFSRNGDYLGGNPSFVKAFGKDTNSLRQLFINSDEYDQLLTSIEYNQKHECDVQLKTESGIQWYHLQATLSSDSKGEAVILLHQNNIDERKRFELSLEKLALTDPLTQLTNRRGLNNTISKLIAQASDKPEPFSLLYIDLDGFKGVNDAYGHNAGDILLIEVAQRILNQLDDQCELARYGGDEFVLLIRNTSSSQHVTNIANRILSVLSRPFDRVPIKSLSASIGSVCFPNDSQDIDDLINYADAAMYYAKSYGKKQYVKYQHGMNQELKRASDIAMKLASAIENNVLRLHYQPIIDTANHKLISFEALLRWVDDELGYVNPEEVIKVAENKGLIEALETWVLNQALSDLTRLQKMYSADLTMSVNMSGLHLSRPDAADLVCSLIEQHHHQPSSLLIELTESVLIDNLDNDDCQIQELVKRGVKVSLDDFGTGYTSLAYLHHLPASILKVDKMFINNFEKHKVTIECISKLSSAFGMTGLVEGIETQEQADTLKAMGFSLQQGNWFGKPQPFEYYGDENDPKLLTCFTKS